MEKKNGKGIISDRSCRRKPGKKGPAYNLAKFGIFAALVIAIIAVTPVSAGEKYMAGSPELTAAVSGTNEFSPGDLGIIPVRLQNKGLNEFKFVQSGIISRDDLPNTAKLMTLELLPGDSGIVVKSDPQMIGDLAGGASTLVNFNVKIPDDAKSGTFDLLLRIRYTYLDNAEQYGTDSIQYTYREMNETLLLPIKIKPDLQFSVISSETEHLNAGTEGYLTIVAQNTGSDEGKGAILKINRNGNSPIIPTDSSMYIGDFPRAADISGKFKVSVSKDAESQTYPLDVLVEYENYEGDVVETKPVTIGVPVGGKVEFSIVSDPVKVSPGEKKVIVVVYENTGGATVYNAQARISAVDPFTSNDDTAYIGTLAPGEKSEAAFEISVDGAATCKDYGLDSEIRFRDALDNSLISDPLKVQVNVIKSTGVVSFLANPLVLGILAVCIIGVGYAVYRRRQEN
ncbi:MAG: S-layer protein [Methanoregulaceae archaeon]|nr:S-layer protein [Methanoregulaceae archaeon]